MKCIYRRIQLLFTSTPLMGSSESSSPFTSECARLWSSLPVSIWAPSFQGYDLTAFLNISFTFRLSNPSVKVPSSESGVVGSNLPKPRKSYPSQSLWAASCYLPFPGPLALLGTGQVCVCITHHVTFTVL